jgi:hypothetical protein
VQVALDPPALGVAELDDAGPGGADLLELGPDLGLEALVLDREAGGGGDRLDQLGLVVEGGVVDQGGDGVAVVAQDRDAAAAARRGQLDRPGRLVHVGLLAGQPVGELDRRVVEGAGQGLLEPVRGRGLLELDGEVADRRPVEPAAGQPGEKGEGPQHQRGQDGQVEGAVEPRRRGRQHRPEGLADAEQDQQDDRDLHHRGEPAPARRRRPAPAADHNPEQQPGQDHVPEVGDRHDRLAVGMLAAGAQQVRRALGAAQPLGVDQQELHERQGHRGRVVGHDEHPLQPGGGPAVGEDGDQVGQDRGRQRGRQQVQRVSGRRMDQSQSGQGVGQPDRDHQGAGVVVGPPRPGHQPDRDERPAHPDDGDHQVEQRSGRGVAGPRDQGEVHQPRGQGGQRERQAQPPHPIQPLPMTASTAAPDSSALGTNPLAPELSTRSP